MFNKKFVSVLCYIVGVLLMFKVLIVLTMFIWGYFGTPPVQIIDPNIAPHIRVLLLIQELGSTIFIYAVLGLVKNLLCGAAKMPAVVPVRKKTTKE